MSNSAMVDQKSRLKIAATLLPTLKGSGTEFYISGEDGSSVRIYPMQVWNEGWTSRAGCYFRSFCGAVHT